MQIRAVSNLDSMIMQGKTVGIIGGGQLGLMLSFSTKEAYIACMICIIFDPNPDCSAGQVSDEQIVAPYDDIDAIE